MNAGRRTILAVASGGGHWVQLLRLRRAFLGHPVVYVTVRSAYRQDLAPEARLRVVNDASRWNPLALAVLLLRLAWIVLRERPGFVVTTGAAPGYLALRLGRLVGARTAWIDSLANVDELSLSGRRAGAHADLWLTQWPHLAREGGPRYEGSVL
jgi:hypothetical protein